MQQGKQCCIGHLTVFIGEDVKACAALRCDAVLLGVSIMMMSYFLMRMSDGF